VFQPTQFGKYYLTRRIAVGGMAEIFQAKLFGVGGFEKQMVVKQILPQYSRNAEFINMFIDEAKIGVTLTHGNIVPVYELGRIGDTYFIALEYVDGKDLAEILEKARAAQKPISPEHAAYVAIEICKGLDYAHRRTNERNQPLGVVHRDISPPNILISREGEVKVTDFGIAKAIHKLGTTESGVVKGTFGYMSPEQVRGLPVDHRTDIFSTGILLHEMLTGRRLFVGKNDLEAIERVKEAQVPAPSAINRNLPGAIDPIVFKALAKDPNDRYTTANEFQLALSRFLFTSGTGATAATLTTYMRGLFGDEADREADGREEIVVSALEDFPPAAPARPKPAVDNATHSYAVRPELEEATAVMDHPAPALMEFDPSGPTNQVAPRSTSNAGGGRARALGETRALPSLSEAPPTNKHPFSAAAVLGGREAEEPRQPQVPELRFSPKKRRQGSKPATLPSIPSMMNKGLEPEEEFPSADELAALADQLEEATTEPRVVASEVMPKAPELVPPVARPSTPPAPVPEEPEVSATSMAETNPERLPAPVPQVAPPEPLASLKTDEEPISLPTIGEDEQPTEGLGNLLPMAFDESGAARETDVPEAPPKVVKVSRKQQSRISGVLSGTLRMFVEGVADDDQEEAMEPSGSHDVIPGGVSGSYSSGSIKVPRTIRPTTIGWILIGTVMVAATAFVLYKKTDLFGGGTAKQERVDRVKPEDIKKPEPKADRLGSIRITTEPAGASFFVFAGETPVQLKLRSLPGMIRVERDGYRGVYRTVKPEEFKAGRADVSVTLEPVGSSLDEKVPALGEAAASQPAAGSESLLTVKSDPPKAMVWRLAGQGTLALTGVKISKSRYFKVVAAEHKPSFVRVSEVDFKDGDEYATNVKLEPLVAAATAASDGAAVTAAATPDAAPATPAASKKAAPAPKPAAKAPAPRPRPRARPRIRVRRRPRRRPRKKKPKPKKTKTKKKGKGISLPSWAQ